MLDSASLSGTGAGGLSRPRARPPAGLAPAELLLAAALSLGAQAEEFSFDASAFEKKPFEFGGTLELKADRAWLNPAGSFTKLNGLDRGTLDRNTATLKLNAKFTQGIASLNLRGAAEARRDDLARERNERFDEAYVSFKPDPGFTLDIGKIALKWGKGYAWNPVGFVERPDWADRPLLLAISRDLSPWLHDEVPILDDAALQARLDRVHRRLALAIDLGQGAGREDPGNFRRSHFHATMFAQNRKKPMTCIKPWALLGCRPAPSAPPRPISFHDPDFMSHGTPHSRRLHPRAPRHGHPRHLQRGHPELDGALRLQTAHARDDHCLV